MLKKVFFFIILFFALAFANRLLEPKYMNGIYEGAMIKEYYASPGPFDVVFLGDCEVYENISTVKLWENYGISSYIRGGPQQLIWQSYYLLEDVFRREKPYAVVYNVLAARVGSQTKEEYNRLNIDGMKLSLSKLNSAAVSIKNSPVQTESAASYIFPILRYHDRWTQLTAEDFKYFFKPKNVTFNGYLMRSDVSPADVIPKGPRLPDYSFPEISFFYLDKILELCKQNGAKLILMKAPTVYPYWYPEWNRQILDYADKNGLEFYNFLELDTGVDLSTDTYDKGFHLNVYGAEKLADYIGKILSEKYDVPDWRPDPSKEIFQYWEDLTQKYYAHKALQEKEFKESGKIFTYIY
jgi:hypothetical protein